MEKSKLILCWFDFLVVGFLIWGAIIGKRRGMSVEALDLLKWLIILLVSSWGYTELAPLVHKIGNFNNYWVHFGSYLGIIIVLKTLLEMLKQRVGKVVIRADAFGKGEFHLGGIAGALRHLCMVIIFCSLANSTPVSEAQLKKSESDQLELLGDIFFPAQGRIRFDILYKSYTGKLIRRRLPQQMMSPIKNGKKK